MDNPWGSPWAEAASRTPSPYRPPTTDLFSIPTEPLSDLLASTSITSGPGNVSNPRFPTTAGMDMSGASAWTTSNDANFADNDEEDAFGDWASPSSHNISVESLVSAEAVAFSASFTRPSEIAPNATIRSVSGASFGGSLLSEMASNGMVVDAPHVETMQSLSPEPINGLTTKSTTVENSLNISNLDSWAGETTPAYDRHTENEAKPRLSEDKFSLDFTQGDTIESPATSVESLNPRPNGSTQPSEPEKHDLTAISETSTTGSNASTTTELKSPIEPQGQPQTISETSSKNALSTIPSIPTTPDITIDASQKFAHLPKNHDGDEPLKSRKTRSSTLSSEKSSYRVQSLVDMYDGIARRASSKSLHPLSQSDRSVSSRTSSSERIPENTVGATDQEPNEKNEKDIAQIIPETAEYTVKTEPLAEVMPTADVEETVAETLESTEEKRTHHDRPQTPSFEAPIAAQHALSPRNIRLPDSPMSTESQSRPASMSLPILEPKVDYRSYIPRDINMGDVALLYEDLCELPTSEREVLPETMYDCFATQDERKFWLRVSRQGSVRRHIINDDLNYKPIHWNGSTIQVETVKIVRRWMEEGSSIGRVMSAVGGRSTVNVAKAATKMFSWNDTSANDPVNMSALTERLQMNKALKEDNSPKPISVPVYRVFHAPSASIGSIDSVVTNPVNSRPASIHVPSVRASPVASPIHPPGTLSSGLPRGSFETTYSKKASISSPATSQPTKIIASPILNSKAASTHSVTVVKPTPQAENDDNEWGEMVSSPVTTEIPEFVFPEVSKLTSPNISKPIKPNASNASTKVEIDELGDWGDIVKSSVVDTKANTTSPVIAQPLLVEEDDDDEWGEMVSSPVITQTPSFPSHSPQQSLDSPGFDLVSPINLPPIPPTFPIIHSPTHSVSSSMTSSHRTPNFPLSPVATNFSDIKHPASQTHTPSASASLTLQLPLDTGGFAPTKPYIPSPLSTAPITLPSPDYMTASGPNSVKSPYTPSKTSPTKKPAVPLLEFSFPMAPAATVNIELKNPEEKKGVEVIDPKTAEKGKNDVLTEEEKKIVEKIIAGLPSLSYMIS